MMIKVRVVIWVAMTIMVAIIASKCLNCHHDHLYHVIIIIKKILIVINHYHHDHQLNGNNHICSLLKGCMPGINSPPGVIVTCQPWPFCAGQFNHDFEYNDDGGGDDDAGEEDENVT